MESFTWGSDEGIAAVVKATDEPFSMELNHADADAYFAALSDDEVRPNLPNPRRPQDRYAVRILPSEMGEVLRDLIGSPEQRANDLASGIAAAQGVDWV